MRTEDPSALEVGVFTISIDFELIWGTLDLFGQEGFRRACELERAVVIDRLLDLFSEFNIPATWCVLGHLMLDSCRPSQGKKHPEIVRPTHSWCDSDWFENDPCGSEDNAPLFFGRSLIDKIRACPVPQEIGCHSFSHVIFGDAGCSRETAQSEIAACIKASREMGVEMKSFAFPRNEVGYLDVLREYGFVSYRGPEPNWYEAKGLPTALKRLGHLWDVSMARTPPVVLPQRADFALWNIPGSMIYFPMHGLRRYIPLSRRVKRAVKGLKAAVDQRRIFHLWFHPTNMADQMEAMFSGLRSILDRANSLRSAGQLAILPMGEIAPVDSQVSIQ